MNFAKIVLLIAATFIFSNSAVAQSTNNIEIWVNGVCGMCKERIEKAALQVSGVRAADWSIKTHILKLTVNPLRFEVNTLHRAIAAVGHDTELVKAPDEVYQNLHECCLYDRSATPPSRTPQTVRGRVLEGQDTPLVGASVFWLGTSLGTTSDTAGYFELPLVNDNRQLVISYVGFLADTVEVKPGFDLEVTLSNTLNLEQVEVTYRRKATEVSFFAPIQVQVISERELLKAACCNLSESFETTPSVDVSFTDAVTGARQIQLLGLSGPNIQVTRENMPDVRGLAALNGLNYTAGPWIEGIQLSLGAGSVVNGFEAISGQINVELRKPEDTDLMYLNLYAAEMGRYEGNLNLSQKLGKRWSTGLLLHAKNQTGTHDQNGDSFLDNPLSKALVGIQRWKYAADNGWQVQFGLKGALLNDQSGIRGFHDDVETHYGHWWGAEVRTRRGEIWAKAGKVFPQKPYKSLGFQFSGIRHEHRSYFGLRDYNGDQKSAYANFIYQNILGNTNHQYRIGSSFQWDNFQERIPNQTFLRDEYIPGVFAEYTWKAGEQFTAVAGMRADHHNNFGLFFTPRLHLSWTPRDLTVIRLSGGRGQRTASILAENLGIWASGRNIIIQSITPDTPYGLNPEVAWNFGANLTQGFSVGKRPATLTIGAYHTTFQQQIIVDFEEAQRLLIYNLDGRSRSNSAMAQLDVEVLPRLDARLAYRFNDVKMTFSGEFREKPLLSRHRAFFNMAYATKSDLHLDFTLNWQGAKRIPSTAANPTIYQIEERSPDFFLANAQISKRWGEAYDLYIGAENLLGFTQRRPIIASDDPFGPYFDSTLVWGPIFGRNIYVGGRWRIKHKA